MTKSKTTHVYCIKNIYYINQIQHDATLVSLKKKQADSISEMSEQMDQLNKMKAK